MVHAGGLESLSSACMLTGGVMVQMQVEFKDLDLKPNNLVRLYMFRLEICGCHDAQEGGHCSCQIGHNIHLTCCAKASHSPRKHKACRVNLQHAAHPNCGVAC